MLGFRPHDKPNSKTKITARAFCDDISLFAKTAENMSELLKICEKHSKKWGYNFNPNKCEILVWNNGKTMFEEKMVFDEGKAAIEKVACYKKANNITDNKTWIYLENEDLYKHIKIPITIFDNDDNKEYYTIEDEDNKIITVNKNCLPEIAVKKYHEHQKYPHVQKEPYQHDWDFAYHTNKNNPFTKVKNYVNK